MTHDGDAILAVRVQEGDRQAFEELLSRYERQIFTFVYHFFHDRALSEDITQETFLRAWRFISSFRPQERFSTWLYSIAKNLCIDELRRLQKGTLVDIDSVDPESLAPSEREGDNPLRAAILAQEGALLRRLVARLPDRYRTCIVLFYFNDLSYDEIASVMQVSLSNTKILLFRGKRLLLELYRRETAGKG